MEYTQLGRTGLKVSRLCLGTMNFGPKTTEEDSFAIMDKALDELAPRLAAHYGEDCPVAVVARASWPDELVLQGTLATISGFGPKSVEAIVAALGQVQAEQPGHRGLDRGEKRRSGQERRSPRLQDDEPGVGRAVHENWRPCHRFGRRALPPGGRLRSVVRRLLRRAHRNGELYGELGGYVHDTHMSQFLPFSLFSHSAGTWTATVGSRSSR